MSTSDWIQAIVALLALGGVIVAVVAVVLSNLQARFLYEVGRFDLVVSCATEATLLASTMNSITMPLKRRNDGAFLQLSEKNELISQSFEAPDLPFPISDWSADKAAFMERLRQSDDATVDRLHELIADVDALFSKMNIACGSLPEKIRSSLQNSLAAEARWLNRAIMASYLSLVPKDRKERNGATGRDPFRSNFLSPYKNGESAEERAGAVERLDELITNYEERNTPNFAEDSEKEEVALHMARTAFNEANADRSASTLASRKTLRLQLQQAQMNRGAARRRSHENFSAEYVAYDAILIGVRDLHALLEKTAGEFTSKEMIAWRPGRRNSRAKAGLCPRS